MCLSERDVAAFSATHAVKTNRAGVVSSKAPSLIRRDPDPDKALMLRVELGWVDDDARFVLVVNPDHTFADLADAITTSMRFEDDHIAAFFVSEDGGSLRASYELGPDTASFAFEAGCPIWVPFLRDEDLTHEGLDGRTTLVSSVLGRGWHCWYLFDFGDRWWFSVRVIGSIAPVRTTTRILMLADAIDVPRQYLDEDDYDEVTREPRPRPYKMPELSLRPANVETDFRMAHFDCMARRSGVVPSRPC